MFGTCWIVITGVFCPESREDIKRAENLTEEVKNAYKDDYSFKQRIWNELLYSFSNIIKINQSNAWVEQPNKNDGTLRQSVKKLRKSLKDQGIELRDTTKLPSRLPKNRITHHNLTHKIETLQQIEASFSKMLRKESEDTISKYPFIKNLAQKTRELHYSLKKGNLEQIETKSKGFFELFSKFIRQNFDKEYVLNEDGFLRKYKNLIEDFPKNEHDLQRFDVIALQYFPQTVDTRTAFFDKVEKMNNTRISANVMGVHSMAVKRNRLLAEMDVTPSLVKQINIQLRSFVPIFPIHQKITAKCTARKNQIKAAANFYKALSSETPGKALEKAEGQLSLFENVTSKSVPSSFLQEHGHTHAS